jgi:hypothetical protein
MIVSSAIRPQQFVSHPYPIQITQSPVEDHHIGIELSVAEEITLDGVVV